MKARIYAPAKNAMQSGRAKTGLWLLEYDSDSTPAPTILKFNSAERAAAFAKKQGLDYTITQPHTRLVVPRNYVDNFKYRPARPNSGK